MSEAEKKAREVARPLNVVEWLTERADNCAKIAHSKSGADAVGWLVDEAYFRAAVAALLQLRRDTIEECAKWHADMAAGYRRAAETIRREWCTPDLDQEDRLANAKDARQHDEVARFHDNCASAILKLAKE